MQFRKYGLGAGRTGQWKVLKPIHIVSHELRDDKIISILMQGSFHHVKMSSTEVLEIVRWYNRNKDRMFVDTAAYNEIQDHENKTLPLMKK